jgi:TatD DNase family protein
VIDTHVHLDDDAFGQDRAAVWERARSAGVQGALLVAVSPTSWTRSRAAAKELSVALALGIHPQVVPELDDATLARALGELPAAIAESGAIAVGECGLDGPAGDLDRQKRVLIAQLEVAKQLGLPVSLHVYGLHAVALELLRAFGPLPRGGAVHSFSGSVEIAREYLRLGLAVSFAGAITRSNAKRPLAAARSIPLDRLLVETDAPFQPTGKDARDRVRGEPEDLRDVLRALASARGEDEAALVEATTKNALAVFPGIVV